MNTDYTQAEANALNASITTSGYACRVVLPDGREEVLLCTVNTSRRKAKRALWHFIHRDDEPKRVRLLEVVSVRVITG